MLNKTIITLLVIASCASFTFAEDIVGGVDLESYDWENICRNIEPIPLETPYLSCEISHPASTWHNYKVIKIGVTRYAHVVNCQMLVDEFTQFKTPTENPGKEWQHCYLQTKSALMQRKRSPESFYHSLESWKNHVFN